MGVVVQLRPVMPALPSFQPGGGALLELGELFVRDFGPRLAPSTLATVRRVLKVATGGARGVPPLPSHPSPADVARWLSALQTAGYAGGTVQLWRGHLHHFYEVGQACRWCEGNPVAAVPWKRLDAQRRALPNVQGVWPFLTAACDSLRERAFLCVLRFAGLRRGEALALEARHIDFQANVLCVDAQRRKPNLPDTTRQLKSEASRRRVPMRAELRATLAELLKAEGETVEVRAGLGGGGRRTTALLFPFNLYQLDGFMKRLRGVVPDGFPRQDAWHVFRHTVACELWTAGKDVESIRQFLGHVSLEKTAVYLRTLVGARVDASVIEGLDPPPLTGGPSPPEKKPRSTESSRRPGHNTQSPKAAPRKQSRSQSTRSTTKGSIR